ncbi:MAG: hypothetical protein JWO82_2117 [Akkermansiaceae bacterium]|nr:hypothetical protein [Akkermansiaceae bacterium]
MTLDKKGKPTAAAPAKGAGEPVPLTDRELVKKLDSAPAESEFAAPFEIILPLSREVQIK